MKYFSIERLSDKTYVSLENNIIFIFRNINDYEDEVYDILKKGLITFSELENHIKSWGGEVEMLMLKDLVKFYVKRKYNNVENR